MVEALGPGVTELKVGDHVILSWAPTCGRCHYCVIGRPNLCERRQPGKGVLPDGTTRMSLGGSPVYHYGHVATYASRTVVHESCAIRIDPAMPLDRAALIGCSVMTGVGAVINTAAVPAGREHGRLRRGRRRPQRHPGRRDGGRASDHRGGSADVQARPRARRRGDPRDRRVEGGPGRRHPGHHRARGRLHLRGGGRHPADHPGDRRPGPGRHLRADRGAGDRRHRAARRAARWSPASGSSAARATAARAPARTCRGW